NTAPVQIAVPVPTGAGSPGDKVYFFVQDQLPTGPNGALQPYWTVVDDGVIGTDGMARSSSPPFPGLTNNANVLVARTAQALTDVRISLNLTQLGEAAFLIAVGLGVASTGGIVGAVAGVGIIAAAVNMLVIPMVQELSDVVMWRLYADG